MNAEVAAWAEFIKSGGPQAKPLAIAALNHWLRDPDLNGVREAAALSKLPPEEQKAWASLWGEVEKLLNQAAK